MKTLLAFRKNIQILYSEYSMQVTIFLKFVLGLVVFHTINSNLGFMERASSGLITFVLAVISSLLPLMVMVVSAMSLILLHFYEIGIAVVTITVVIFTVLYIFYFRFTPGRTWVILLVPLAFYFNVPFVVPIIFGLISTPVMVVPAFSGTIVFYLLHYVQTTETSYYVGEGIAENGEAFYYAGEGIVENIEQVVEFVTTVVANEEQWLLAFVLGVGVLLVYAIRTRSFKHCWKVAYLAGILWSFVATRVGGNIFEIEVESSLLWTSAFVALILGVVFEFLFYNVDYSKTQYLQFDDNDYYYYVKAIPKQLAPEKGRSNRKQGERSENKESQRGDVQQRKNRGPGEDGVPRSGRLSRGSRKPEEGKATGRVKPKSKKDGLELSDGQDPTLQETMVIGSDTINRSLPKASQIRAETESILLTRSLNSELGLTELESKIMDNVGGEIEPTPKGVDDKTMVRKKGEGSEIGKRRIGAKGKGKSRIGRNK